ncbi:OPT/YSL family transporter [Methylobacterium sp. M6A4_1b]
MALIAGVTVVVLVIAPLLSLFYRASGFAGALLRPDMDAGSALPVPQAALMTQIATGIVHGEPFWTMLRIGAGLGVVFVALVAVLRRRDLSFSTLTVGIGIYLPPEVVVTIVVGASSAGSPEGASRHTLRKLGRPPLDDGAFSSHRDFSSARASSVCFSPPPTRLPGAARSSCWSVQVSHGWRRVLGPPPSLQPPSAFTDWCPMHHRREGRASCVRAALRSRDSNAKASFPSLVF